MGERLLNSLAIWLYTASVTLAATRAETHRGYSSNKKQRDKALAKKWGGRAGLNRRPPESQSGALPTELRPPFLCFGDNECMKNTRPCQARAL